MRIVKTISFTTDGNRDEIRKERWKYYLEEEKIARMRKAFGKNERNKRKRDKRYQTKTGLFDSNPYRDITLADREQHHLAKLSGAQKEAAKARIRKEMEKNNKQIRAQARMNRLLETGGWKKMSDQAWTKLKNTAKGSGVHDTSISSTKHATIIDDASIRLDLTAIDNDAAPKMSFAMKLPPQPKAAAPKKTVSKARQKTKTNKKKRPNQQLEVNYRRPTKRSHKVSARGRLNDIFSQVLDNSEVKKYKDFFNPIDAVLRRLKLPHLIPVYEEKIPHPMCFKHIKTRCNKRNKETYYGTREEFEADVKQIATNSRLFNGPVSPVTVKAEQVVQLVLQKLREFDAELNKTTAEMRKEAGYQPYNAAAGGSRGSGSGGRDGSLVSSSIAASSAGPPSQVSIMDQDALAMDEEDLDDLMFDDDED